MIKTTGLQFRKFRQQTRVKGNPCQPHKSPKPTSFRELSESRQKNKLLSGKKSLLDKANELKTPDSKMNSAKKEANLFSKLLNSKSPASAFNPRPFDEVKNSSNDSGLTFSAFKGISLKDDKENSQNISKKQNKENNGRGLQFKNFPHKRTNIKKTNNAVTKCSTKLLHDGPLIGRSQKSLNQDTSRMELSRKPSAFTEATTESYDGDRQVGDSVIRSRADESLKFDMSPAIL